MCNWVVNIVRYNATIKNVKPKKEAAAKANSEKEAAESGLRAVEAKVAAMQVGVRRFAFVVPRWFVG